MKFHVPDMSCGHCTAAIEKAIFTQDSTAKVTTDLESRQVSVDSTLPIADLQKAIGNAGYEATTI
ncbi:MAG: heavy-metal-associated domain-containing protein [Hyphomicrobiales bacterium]